ncbi:hypothetical protein C2845_PM09G23020 [Panicum miliaceum]|uniref:Uncharacterized protein n=1 Tax=Panicum miliaceum TaxID=4540 RepID=A0A3L6S0D1_PANMI|nr:hypothetical protein C2845_PM09G23020 [Panicum miliaceum]
MYRVSLQRWMVKPSSGSPPPPPPARALSTSCTVNLGGLRQYPYDCSLPRTGRSSSSTPTCIGRRSHRTMAASTLRQNRASKLARSSVPSTRASRNVRSRCSEISRATARVLPRVGAAERERLEVVPVLLLLQGVEHHRLHRAQPGEVGVAAREEELAPVGERARGGRQRAPRRLVDGPGVLEHQQRPPRREPGLAEDAAHAGEVLRPVALPHGLVRAAAPAHNVGRLEPLDAREVAAHALVVAGVLHERGLADLLRAHDGEHAQVRRAAAGWALQQEVDDALLLDVAPEHAPVHVQRRPHRPVNLPGVALHQQDELPHVVARQDLQILDDGGQPLRAVVTSAAPTQEQPRDAGRLRLVERRAQRERSLARRGGGGGGGASSVVTVVVVVALAVGVPDVVEVGHLEREAAALHAHGERLEVGEQLLVGDVAALGLLDHAADVAQQLLQPAPVRVPGAGRPKLSNRKEKMQLRISDSAAGTTTSLVKSMALNRHY